MAAVSLPSPSVRSVGGAADTLWVGTGCWLDTDDVCQPVAELRAGLDVGEVGVEGGVAEGDGGLELRDTAHFSACED